MPQPNDPAGGRRETRLLLVTIGISIGALLLLARFRFPENDVPSADPAPAPFERLAARAAYDEMASTMADLERRIVPRVLVLRAHPERPSGAYIVAPRVTPSRAVAVLEPGERAEPISGAGARLVARDIGPGIAVFDLAPGDDLIVTPRSSPPRQGPRYVAVVEGSPQGPTLRPVYVGRIAMYEEPRAAISLLSLAGLQAPIPRGAAVFSLDGAFLGIVSQSGSLTSVVGADFLRAAAEGARQSAAQMEGDLGLDVDDPDAAVLRATGASGGVVVSYVRPGGPASKALQPGDVIQSIDGRDVPDVTTFRHLERLRPPDAATTVVFVRRGQRQTATFSSGNAAALLRSDEHGIVGRGIAGVGIEVIAVESGSAAARAGVQRGDLIRSVDGQSTTDPAALSRSYGALNSGQALLLTLERNRRYQVLALEKR